MWWFNSERRRLYEMKEFIVGPGYTVLSDAVFTTDWQEITIELDQAGLVWQDSLFYFELYLGVKQLC